MVKTSIDNKKGLINDVKRSVRSSVEKYKYDVLYKQLIDTIMINIQQNKEKELLLCFHPEIKDVDNTVIDILENASEKDKAYFRIGTLYGLCNFIESLGNYEEYLNEYLKPYYELNIEDTVYVKIGGIIHKTHVKNKIKDKIQVEYNRRWFCKEDYLDCIFPYDEQKNLLICGELKDCERCDDCFGFKQGKCAYGYSVKTYKDYKYTFNNTKIKITKGYAQEPCSKRIK